MRRRSTLQDLALFAHEHLGETAEQDSASSFEVVMDAFVHSTDGRAVRRDAGTSVWQTARGRVPHDPGLFLDVDRFVEETVTYLEHQYVKRADAAGDRRALSHLFRAHLREANHASAPGSGVSGRVSATRSFRCVCGFAADGDEEELYRLIRAHVDRVHPEHHRSIPAASTDASPREVETQWTTVVVAVDRPAALQSVGAVLEASGYSVASDIQADELAEREISPGVVLLHLTLPEGHSATLVDRLRRSGVKVHAQVAAVGPAVSPYGAAERGRVPGNQVLIETVRQ
jgi:CheY-like chemotaxis protein